MACSLLVLFTVIGVFLSIFPDNVMSNARFFRKYGLRLPKHLDQSVIKKLKNAYIKCFHKFNSLDKNTLHIDQVPENQDIPSHSRFWELPDNPSMSNKVTLWPNNTIPMKLSLGRSKSKRESLENRLACAIKYFHAMTCIRFVPKQKHHKNYLLISNKGSVCSSDSVGMKVGKQTVNLPGTSDDECWRHGVTVHEMMHAIGLFHEHQRNDRDEHIDIIDDHIPPILKKQFDTIEEMGYENYPHIGKYDFSSIMHYGSKIGKLRAVVAKFSKYKFKSYDLTEKMGNRERPTEMDTLKVKELYQCDRSPTIKGPITTSRQKYLKCSSANCCDKREHCETWSKTDLCEVNPDFMNLNCRMSCRKCGTSKRSTQAPKTTTEQSIDNHTENLKMVCQLLRSSKRTTSNK